MSPRGLVTLAALALALAFPAGAGAAAVEVGRPAPAYEAQSVDGDARVSLEGLRGRAVLLNKWATWCRPCVEEMPELQRLHERFGEQGFTVVGVSVDRPGPDAPIQAVALERGATYPLWRDPDDLFTSTFRSTGVPDSILLDRDGRVVHRWIGGLRADAEAERLVRAALSPRGAGAVAAAPAAPGAGAGPPIGLVVALAAGVLSFLSPCVLPLVPGYVAFVTGITLGGAGRVGAGVRSGVAAANGALFVAGFTTVFLLLGASAAAAGAFLRDHSTALARVGGVLVLVMGLHLLGVARIPGLDRDTRPLARIGRDRGASLAGSYVVGAAFGAGWTPCIGPVLAGILTLAATRESFWGGMGLLAAYSIGLAVPFLLATLALDRFLTAQRGLRRLMPLMDRMSGVLLVCLGVVLVSGAMTGLSGWFARFLPDGLG